MRAYLFSLCVVSLLIFLPGVVQGYSIRSTTTYNTSSVQNVAIYTPLQRVHPSADFNLSFAFGSDAQRLVKFVLHPNHDLLAQQPHIRFINGNGHRSELMKRDSHRVFRGAVLTESSAFQWEEAGWARINLIRDGREPLFTGAFSISGMQYDIKLDRNTAAPSQRRMMIYQSNEDSFPALTHEFLWTYPLSTLKRQWTPSISSSDLIDTIGDDSGCPTERQIALVGIATDCTYTASFDSSEDLVQDLITMVNTASGVFESAFNVALAFHNLTISDSDCPSTPSANESWNVGCSAGDLDFRLDEFSTWRSGLAGDDNAYWTLMTGCATGTEVGVSWIGELCNDRGANVVAASSNQWQVFAHESGHTFGAYHDCESTQCSSSSRQCCPLSESTCSANGEYIMNPVSTSPQQDFSPCSIGNVCSALGSGAVETRCLTTNTDIPTVSAGECGNGIVEVGEECDCGDDCDGNECCDGATCRFREGAVCDASSGEACCEQCQFTSRGTVCRASRGECDIEETCPLDSGDCPDDQTEDDGQSCGSEGGLFCSSGQCTNRDLQCQSEVTRDNSTITSCGNSTCILSCSGGETGSCSSIGDVLDGTPCDGGLCQGGTCQSSSNEGNSWFDRHRSLVIGLVAGIGGLLVLSLLVCIIWRCCRRRPKSMTPMQAPLPPTRHVQYVPPPAYTARPVQTPYYRYA
ncbi:Metallo-peptidase family M12-domain-containing protein [Aspergillus unguis]